MPPVTAQVPGNGTATLTFTIPGDGLDVESVYAIVDNSAGASAVTPELTIQDQSGVVIARKMQGDTIPAGATGSATWALRLDDESAGGGTDPLAVKFDTSPQSGTFLEATATSAGTAFDLIASGGGAFNIESSGGGGGFVGITTSDGEVFIGSTSIVNRLAAGGAFEVQKATAVDVFQVFNTGDVQIRAAVLDVAATTSFIFALPTAAPAGANRLWNNGGVVNIT